ncbi:MAG: cytochrome P460 family protein [bacterium]|nr:cytochrome P460 family protein [bacterium]
MLRTRSLAIVAAAMALAIGASAQMMKPPFGDKTDVAYSKALWRALNKKNLVGAGAVNTVPQPGQTPHGMVIETLFDNVKVKGHSGQVVVKRNYGGPDVTPSKVSANRGQYLKAVTVMFKRESGFDPDNGDWFWAKYLPDGSLDKHPKGMLLAGRVAKGMKEGCIACHTAAGGGDYLFLNDAARIDKKK